MEHNSTGDLLQSIVQIMDLDTGFDMIEETFASVRRESGEYRIGGIVRPSQRLAQGSI